MKALTKNNAEGFLAVATGESSLVQVGEGEGSLFPSITEGSFDFFYIRIGSEENHVVVKVINRVGDIFTTDQGTITVFPIGTPVRLTACEELFSQYHQSFPQNLTIHIAENSADFATIADFVTAMSEVQVGFGYSFTVHLHGHFPTERLETTDFLDSRHFSFIGDTLPVEVTSVESVSGSAGAYSVILNLVSATDIVVGDYLVVPWNGLSGGTFPEALFGAHEITAVDTVENQITITNACLSASTPSGAVAGTVTVYQTVVKGIRITESPCFYFESIVVADAANEGVVIDTRLPMFAGNSLFCVVGKADVGINMTPGSAANISGIVSRCATGVLKTSSSAEGSNLLITGCTDGILALVGSRFLGDPKVLYCNTGLTAQEGSVAYLYNPVFYGNTAVAIHASTYSYISTDTPDLMDNLVDFDPVSGTQGNIFGYINDVT